MRPHSGGKSKEDAARSEGRSGHRRFPSLASLACQIEPPPPLRPFFRDGHAVVGSLPIPTPPQSVASTPPIRTDYCALRRDAPPPVPPPSEPCLLRSETY